ncbi:nuclear transport factor 2 family protein [Crossiella cryophila]|uniref:3-phenylpropionate/cinnamic acid dioxygenase small subunit n=1 Tax=Crossiella cryophila TaxID=43355 RepID=A0A7W7CDW4_9PSEU|nr:nuclear transport factor 2 family protein [Crossiella cryophila]MBB4679392.1 3-phenylpropionate/cinnamic acid dioxygenase small subunit [Crossiella cryophila]
MGISSAQAIEHLMLRYAEHVDAGEFDQVGELFAEGSFRDGSEASGAAAVAAKFREMLVVYPDGTPRTKHVTTNILIEVDEDAGTATARAYFTVLQAVPELPLQIIAAGRYRDTFRRREGRWRFAARHAQAELLGELRFHLSPRVLAGIAGR